MSNFIRKILVAENTKKFTVGVRDVAHALIYFIVTSVGVAVAPNIKTLTLPSFEEVQIAALAGLSTGAYHLLRKFLTTSTGVLLIEPEPAIPDKPNTPVE